MYKETDDYLLDTLDLLSKDRVEENRLNALWKAHSIDRHVKAALDSLFEDENSGLIRLIRNKVSELRPAEIRESIKRADIRINFPMVAMPPQPSRSPVVSKLVSPVPHKHKTPAMLGVQVSDLIQAGLINLPLKLERKYKGVHLKATIQQDGRVTFDGEPYDSLSTAAGMARKSVIGAPPGRYYPQTNGWTFWQYHDTETGKLEEIDLLRQRYLERSR